MTARIAVALPRSLFNFRCAQRRERHHLVPIQLHRPAAHFDRAYRLVVADFCVDYLVHHLAVDLLDARSTVDCVVIAGPAD